MVAIALPWARAADLLELTKPRIVGLVVVTAAAGFYLAAPARVDLGLLLHTLVGTMLAAAGTNALNQVAERDVDARMRRTAGRPIPAGRVSWEAAAVFAWLSGTLGVGYLIAFVNPLTGGLAALTLVWYVFLYTPLKRRTTLATWIGAVPGALPVVGGWTAAGGPLGLGAWVLFGILFLWQIPHFLALAWMYRDDYVRAGLRMVSVGDPEGSGTFRQATLYAAALLAVSLLPTLVGLAGPWYLLGAALLSGWFVWVAVATARGRSVRLARRLFVTSVWYLPALLALLVADKVA